VSAGRHPLACSTDSSLSSTPAGPLSTLSTSCGTGDTLQRTLSTLSFTSEDMTQVQGAFDYVLLLAVVPCSREYGGQRVCLGTNGRSQLLNCSFEVLQRQPSTPANLPPPSPTCRTALLSAGDGAATH